MVSGKIRLKIPKQTFRLVHSVYFEKVGLTGCLLQLGRSLSLSNGGLRAGLLTTLSATQALR